MTAVEHLDPYAQQLAEADHRYREIAQRVHDGQPVIPVEADRSRRTA